MIQATEAFRGRERQNSDGLLDLLIKGGYMMNVRGDLLFIFSHLHFFGATLDLKKGFKYDLLLMIMKIWSKPEEIAESRGPFGLRYFCAGENTRGQ